MRRRAAAQEAVADDAGGHPLVRTALAEGCSGIEAALWALIGDASGVLHGGDSRLRGRIRRYVADRRRGRASAATLLGLLRTARAGPSGEALDEIALALDESGRGRFG